MIRSAVSAWLLLVMITSLGGCSDGGDGSSQPPLPESQRLLEQFGSVMDEFTQSGMQALLDYEDQATPVTLLQLTSVRDADRFAEYEAESARLWDSEGATVRFASSTFVQMLGERPMDETRVIRFPNITALLDTIRSPAFIEAMELLYLASHDLTWVLGVEQELLSEPAGSFVDPDLQGIDEALARRLLGIPDGVEPPPAAANIINMLASDTPSPFWMVNLIKFREQAQYEDGRDTTLTGREANEIYGDTILPRLAEFNSHPGFTMDVSISLTDEPSQWETAAIVRYASRDAFLNIFPLNPASQEALAHKNAGVETTNVYATEVPSEVIAAPQSGPLYNFRYCEVLLLNLDSGVPTADVYNSMGRGNCPQEQWDALDATAIAQEFGAVGALLNGVRFWVLDSIENNGSDTGEPAVANFGGIEMFLGASVEIAAANGMVPESYRANRVSRSTIFHYVAGRQVYELVDSEGTRYMMQSFTQGVDRTQKLVDLQFLGRRLDLPPGWRFDVRILSEDFQLPSVDGIAEVVTDNLGNTYQRVP